MKAANFNSWADFKEYGINFLTGEACGYSMRLLCDVSEKGKGIVARFLGLPVDAPMLENWNSMVGDDPAVASVMLPRGLFKELARYIAFAELNLEYVTEAPDGSVSAYSLSYLSSHNITVDEAKNRLGGSWYTNPAVFRHGTVIGGRNVHAMSGRAS